MPEKYEIKMVDDLIKMHKRNCNTMMTLFFVSLSVIIMNITLWVLNKNITTVAAFCTGTLVFSGLYNLVMWSMERQDLRLEKERRAFYKRVDIEEQKHLRELGALFHQMGGESK